MTKEEWIKLHGILVFQLYGKFYAQTSYALKLKELIGANNEEDCLRNLAKSYGWTLWKGAQKHDS